MRELALGDWRVRELMVAISQPQSLVSYHLGQLRAGGLVTARRSSFDARDTYYSLDLDGCAGALANAVSALHPGLAIPLAVPEQAVGGTARLRVLFVCTGNTGRSPWPRRCCGTGQGRERRPPARVPGPSRSTRTRWP